jgi:hypothetical protein
MIIPLNATDCGCTSVTILYFSAFTGLLKVFEKYILSIPNLVLYSFGKLYISRANDSKVSSFKSSNVNLVYSFNVKLTNVFSCSGLNSCTIEVCSGFNV